MKTIRSILSALALGGVAAAPAQSANVSPTDPSPNAYDPVTYEPLAGGVGYQWTVNMGPDDQAEVEGLVGAWSWDEDRFPSTAKGWTHTSNWVALKLRQAARVTIRLDRKQNVPDGMGGVGENNLYPAFTLYRNWDGDGGDDHTYNNRGNVAWAEDLVYLRHVENAGTATTVEMTIVLPAGEYSLALGGNSPSTLSEPKQGYGATIVTEPLAKPTLTLTGGPVFRTTEPSHVLSGRIAASRRAKSIEVSHGGRKRLIPVRGDTWTFKAGPLDVRRNVLWLSLIDLEGKVADRIRVVIHRTAPPAGKRPGGMFLGF